MKPKTIIEPFKIKSVEPIRFTTREEREVLLKEAGYNPFLLPADDVLIDLLTDSGTSAMSAKQWAGIMEGDESYAGSKSFYRFEAVIKSITNLKYIIPTHQGRAAENLLGRYFIKPGDVIPMNYHFTTTKAHMEMNGGKIFEIYTDEALKIKSSHPFKGNIDLVKLKKLIADYGAEHVPFIRMEASTNLIGGQPFSIQNMRDVKAIADQYNIIIVLDASLIGENAYFVKMREPGFSNTPVKDILREMCGLADIVYFSSRKVSSTRGGGICTNNKDLYMKMRDLVPLFEGFLTYGGMSVREIEAMAVGLYETCDDTVISQSPSFIAYAVEELDKMGIPVVTPPGALGCHIDAMNFLSHVPQSEYPAGALAAALFIASGCRGMERGTISSVRDENGIDVLADVELLRLAFPRRVFTLSQTMFLIDRVNWLYQNRSLIGGLRFVEEPPVLRFFLGRLEPVGDWPVKLIKKYREDFGDSL